MILRLFRSSLLLVVCLGICMTVHGQKDKKPIPTPTNRILADDVARFIKNYKAELKNAESITRAYRLQRVILQDQINDLEKIKPLDKAKIVKIETKIKSFQKQEKVAAKNLKKLMGYQKPLDDIGALPLAKQQKLVSKIEGVYQKLPKVFPPPTVEPLSERARVVAATPKPKPSGKKKPNTVTATRTSKTYAVYDASKDVMINPPSSDCSYAYRGVDEFLGQEKIELESEQVFFHTDPAMRPYLKGKEYIECDGALAYTQGGAATLNLEFRIQSQTAQREFGGIQKGSVVSFKLVNGTIVKLLGLTSDLGIYDEVTGTTRFRNQYALQKTDEKNLSEFEIDKIRVVWVNGYEDYDVYAVDFMMKQLKCLFNEN